jgi:hypothetical protein
MNRIERDPNNGRRARIQYHKVLLFGQYSHLLTIPLQDHFTRTGDFYRIPPPSQLSHKDSHICDIMEKEPEKEAPEVHTIFPVSDPLSSAVVRGGSNS